MRRLASFGAAAAIVLAAAFGVPGRGALHAAEGVSVTRDGVAIYVAQSRFSGSLESFDRRAWEAVPVDKLPRTVKGYPVMVAKDIVAALSAAEGTLSVSTRRNGRLTHRGDVRLDAKGPVRLTLVVPAKRPGLAVEVFSQDEKLLYAVGLRADGILEIQQQPGRELSVQGRMQHVVLPSPVGADLLYGPDLRPSLTTYYLPSTHLVVGLMGQRDCMMVGVFPPGNHRSRISLDSPKPSRAITGLSIAGAPESFYLTYIERPSLWHEESLRAEYLEKDTPIEWQRPFDAKWIGRFYVESDRYHFPFYFRHEKAKLWGRYIRGWFHYPFWFDGQKTMVHFEKKFPPKGKLLIYYLEGEKKTPAASPVGVMEAALGSQSARGLLDFDGVSQRILLKHGNAVCAMTQKIEEAVAAHNEEKKRAQIEAFADDVWTFIRLIRERVFEFSDFAGKTKALLADAKKAHPALAGDLKPIENLLVEIQERAKDELPKATLDEVRQWTDRIKAVTAEARAENLAKVKKLGGQCRSVAGTQDDLDRELSVLTIRVMEAAAAMGVQSPDHVRLADEIIARCRAVLRRPTWWEPVRQYTPKSNPGAP